MAVAFLDNWEVLELIEQQKGSIKFEEYSSYGLEIALENYANGKFDTTIHNLIRKNPLYLQLSKNYDKIKQNYEKFNKQFKRI